MHKDAINLILSHPYIAIAHHYHACIIPSFSDLTVAIAAGLATYKFGLVSSMLSFCFQACICYLEALVLIYVALFHCYLLIMI